MSKDHRCRAQWKVFDQVKMAGRVPIMVSCRQRESIKQEKNFRFEVARVLWPRFRLNQFNLLGL